MTMHAEPEPDAIRSARGRYAIKCDDCKGEIGRTDSVGRSAQGGFCDPCSLATQRLALAESKGD